MDGSVCQNQQHLILVSLSNGGLSVLLEGGQDFSEVSWARQRNIALLESLPVDVEDVLDSGDFRGPWVAIQRETVVGFLLTLGDTTEAKSRELPVVIVRFEDLADASHGSLVLVEILGTSKEVQRLTVAWIAVGGCEVHSDCHGELHTRAENVHEGGHLNPLELLKSNRASGCSIIFQLMLEFSID